MLKLFSFIAIVVAVLGDKCPNDGEIFERGISDQGKIDVVASHNKYRLQIASGNVTGQPKGINLKKMKYDVQLGEKGRVVSDTCKMDHVTINDDRWKSVGQNLYISWSSTKSSEQQWDKAVTSWFKEYKDFVYPDKSNGVTGHYTQVVWADSTDVGCDFVLFYDKDQPKFPYAKLYTCNYGPAGNMKGTPPYKTGTSGCENLC